MNANRPVLTLATILAAAGFTVSAAATITGQWNFESGNLQAAIGYDLQYLDGPGAETQARTVFGTSTALGLPDIGGEPAGVMGFPRSLPHMGYVMDHGMPANGGGVFVNQYTLIFDLLFPADSGNQWRALIQIDDPTNQNDADLFINPAGGIGIAGQYQGTVQVETWHRLAFAFDLVAEGGPLLRKYIDGVLVGQQVLGQGLDGRWALSPAGGMFDGSALLFTDDNTDGGHVQPGFVSSIQVHDVALSSAYLGALGAPVSTSIPTTVSIPVTMVSRQPAEDAVNVMPGSNIVIVLEPGSAGFNPATVQLQVNEQVLSPTVTSADGQFEVRAALPALATRSDNTLSLRFDDPTQGGEVTVTWDFRMAAFEDDPELDELLRAGLISYWKLDDGEADAAALTLMDAVGSNHGTVDAGSAVEWWTTGANARFGGALRVDGEEVYGLIPASDSLNINANHVTLSLWVNLEQLPSDLPASFGGIYDSGQDSYVLYLDRGANELRFKVTDAAGHAARPGIPAAELRVNEWLHIVGVYDGEAGTGYGEARVYLNGQLMDVHVGNDGSGGTGLTGAVRPGQVAGLGRDGPTAQYFLQATIDDVAVWDRALSADAIGYLATGRAVPAVEVGPEPLRIAEQPVSQTVVQGATVALRVVREGGTPPYSFQWHRNGVDLPGETGGVLFLSADPGLSGDYSVRIQDATTSVSSEPATLTIVALAAAPAESLTQGQVAHWPFDEDFRSLSSGFDGEVGGEAVIESAGARIGAGSVRFTQADQSFVRIPTRVIPDGGLSYTIAGWFDLTGGTDRRFLWETYPNNWAISAEIRADGALSFSMMQEDGHWQGQNTGIVPAAGWHHVAVTYDGNPGLLTLYYDGVESGQITLNPRKGTATTTGLNLGTYRGANARFFEGRLDDVGVWSRVLTPGEVQFLASGNAIPTPVFVPIQIAVEIAGDAVTVSWTGDRPSYQLQRRAALAVGDWENVGEPTSDTQATDVISGSTMFYRIVGL